MSPAPAVDQLRRYAHTVARLANAAFQHEVHPQLPGDLLHVDAAPFVGERGIARDHEQALEARQLRDDVFHHAVDEVLLLRIATHVGKRQHGDRRFVGE